MNLASIVMALFGAYYFVCGLATLITGKVYGQGSSIAAKYTEASIRSAAPLLGISTALIGLSLSADKVCAMFTTLSFMEKYSMTILIVGVVLSTIFMCLGYSKMTPKEK